MMSVKNISSISKSSKCPCGSGLKYSKCCGQYLKQGRNPLTAESLMRSRYTAYVLKDEAYLLNCWHTTTRPSQLDLEKDFTDWLNLEILMCEAGKEYDNKGKVEFIANFKLENTRQQIHEVSRFIKENERWFYLDGEISP